MNSKANTNNQRPVLLDVRRMPTRSQINRVEWDVVVPFETNIEDVLKPEFWSNVTENTFFRHKHNKVSVHWEGGKKYAELYVLSAGHNYAKTAVLGFWDFEKEAPDFEDFVGEAAYSITWTGPSTQYRVIRKSDDQVMRDGFKTEEQAQEFVDGLGR